MTQERVDVRAAITEAIDYYESWVGARGAVGRNTNPEFGAFLNSIERQPALDTSAKRAQFLRGIQSSPAAMSILDEIANGGASIPNRNGYLGVLAEIYGRDPGGFAAKMQQLDMNEARYILREAQAGWLRGSTALRDFGDNGRIDRPRTAALDDRTTSFAALTDDSAGPVLTASFTPAVDGPTARIAPIAPAIAPVVAAPVVSA